MTRAVVHLGRNNQGRDIVVGDIHGAYGSLEAELRRISFEPASDRLICVGDLVDRGPESQMVSRWLKEPWFHCVLGNHDVSLLLSTRDQVPAWMPDQQSRACAFGLMCQEHDWWRRLDDLHQDAIVGALSQLPLAIEIETEVGQVGVIHASVPQGLSWQDLVARLQSPALSLCSIEPLIWGRTDVAEAMPLKDADSPVDDDPRAIPDLAHVFHGHNLTRDRTVWRLANRYFLETGGWLWAARPDVEARMSNPSHWTLVDARYPGIPL